MKKFNFFGKKTSEHAESCSTERSVATSPTTARESNSVVINVIGVPDVTSPWVFTNKSPIHPMPAEDGFTGELPIISAVSPMCWFYKKYYQPKNGLIFDISEEFNNDLWCFAYGPSVSGVKKVYVSLDEGGILTAICWGYYNKPFEVIYMTDARSLFSDCFRNGALSTDMVDSNFIYEHLNGTIEMSKAAFGISISDAKDVLDVLLITVSSAIARTSDRIFHERLNPELTHLGEYMAEKKAFLEGLNNELDVYISMAMHRAPNESAFKEVQRLLFQYFELSKLVKSTYKTYQFYMHLNETTELKFDLSFVEEVYALNDKTYQRIYNSFELIR